MSSKRGAGLLSLIIDQHTKKIHMWTHLIYFLHCFQIYNSTIDLFLETCYPLKTIFGKLFWQFLMYNFFSFSHKVLVQSCNNLKYVNLKKNNWLDSIQLMLLLHKHHNLAVLDLSSCNNDYMHHGSIDISKCENLTSIKLQNCTWVTERFLLNLAQCTKLQKVILADCYQVSDQAVISLCQNSGRLSHISFENLTISDQTLYAAALYCKTIQEFCLRRCLRITDAGLLSLRSLPFLTKLEVIGCVRVTERGLAPMRGKVEIDLPPKPICQPQPLSLQV
ncbi:F-box/LRR-repeat protein 15 isoform X1 [Neodiprion lecontei]|uniref:F-box/LRR-repeat protein 15 isoform X1 n=1 Tax=Neodiprion lecontei TaxID=441921 RepID=A0ABM3FCN9_NEOLC|nr:F-box/LRR-repeat protein 15 isoform X1 [Neodiprion lecontei]